MPPALLPRRRLIGGVLLLALPSLVVLLGLVILAGLPFADALIAALLLMLGLALLLGAHLRHLVRVTDYATGMAAGRPAMGPGASPLSLDHTIAPRLVEALRGWRDREAGLAAHAALADRILGELPDPLLLVDGEKQIRLANPAAERLFEGPLPGRNLLGVLRQPELLEAVDHVLEGGEAETVEFTIPVPVERNFDAHVMALPAPATMRGATDESTALLLLRDMTKVMRADRLRADFVANASHELRTPLATMLGFIETLRGPARDDAEARQRFLAIMQEQASRMARLVADLLSLSRIELNEHSMPTGTSELKSVLGSVANSLALKAEARGMRIELPPPADLAALPRVQGDNDELIQLFQNLIDNAIKYGRAGTSVRVTAGRSEPPAAMTPPRPAVAVSVIDQGEGIARQHLPRLTERFYRVDTARSRDLGGTGLGLAIVKHIVSRHRGALEIESEVGEGSRFVVYLPVADPRIVELALAG